MQKKVVIFLAVLGVVLLGGGLWWFSQKETEVVSPLEPASEQNFPTKAAVEVLTWDDPAGFIFNYPFGIKINTHPEDKVNYANLELTADNVMGKITILASDSKYKTVEEWATKDRMSQLTGGGEEISLGGKKARKLVFADTKRTMVGVIDEGILFTIDFAPEKSGFWQKAFDQIVDSFEFWYPTPVQSGPGSSAGSDIIEEEEIIE